MPKLERLLVVKGRLYDIEYAVRSDQSLPARKFLLALKERRWPDPENEGLPDDAQLSDFHAFLDACKHLANEGEPAFTRQFNALDDGLWEIKRDNKRVSWYDTDAAGNYSPKHKIRDVSTSPYPDSDYWWFPQFDRTVRLGYAFPKTGDLTEQHDMDEALLVREEDLAHDREQS